MKKFLKYNENIQKYSKYNPSLQFSRRRRALHKEPQIREGAAQAGEVPHDASEQQHATRIAA